MFKKKSNGLKKTVSVLMIGVFIFSFFMPIVSVLGAKDNSAPEPSGAVVAINSLLREENLLMQLRKDKEDFKSSKVLEESEAAKAVKEKVASKKKAIETKREELRVKKDAKRKAVLIRLLDIQIKQLENTRERVLKMASNKPDFKAQQAQLNTSIDAAFTALSAKKEEVINATTAEQMKKLAKDIKDLLKTKRDIVRVIVDGILFLKANETIATAEARLAEIKVKIAELKAAGQDTAALDALLAVAQSKIAVASAKIEKKEIKEAVSDLKDAYKDLKKVLEKTDDNAE